MSIKRLGGLVVAMGLLAALVPTSAFAVSGSWDVSGSYGVAVTLDPSPSVYAETMVLTQTGTSITGTYIDYNGGPSYFAIAGGAVAGTAVAFTGSNSGGLTIDFTGTIAGDRSMSGTWADEAPGARTGTWATTSGLATFVPTPTATIRLIKRVLPADDSLWNFVITNGLDATYATYADKSAPFDTGVLTVDNPTNFEIDEWAGTGTDFGDYTAAVACTDNGTSFSPDVSTYYDYGTQHRFYVYFVDAQAGHDYVCTFTNTNPYDFAGFFAPVDNLPVLNIVKAGQAIPVKFSLGGDEGLNVFWTGFPKSSPIACSSSTTSDAVEETVTAGASSLSYDSLTQTYTYVWKTDKTWASGCRQLQVKLADGTSHFANFQFKK